MSSVARAAASPGARVELSGARFVAAAVAIAVANGLATLDTVIANTALPTIAADLHASPAASVWVVNAYQFIVLATLLPLASLGEILGLRRIYVGGILLFTVASVVCAFAWSVPSLSAARALQGLGAAGIMSVNNGLVRFVYPADRIGRGIGLNALIVGITFAVGPTVASVILSVGPWPWLFAINVPLGVVALVLSATALPDTVRSPYGFDAVAAVLCGGACGLMVLGFGEATHRSEPWRIGVELGVAALCGLLLLRRQAGHPAPLLALDLFRRPYFALSGATAICAFAVQGLAFVAIPFYFEMVLGRSQVETGFLMTPWPVMVAVMAMVAGRLADRYGAGLLGGIGLVLLGGGMLSLALLPAHPSVADITWRMCLGGAGFGFFQAPNLKAMLTSVPLHRSGAAGAMSAVVRLIGQTSGAALVALCFGLSATHGSTLALALGVGFAGVGAVVSGLRQGREPGAS